MPSSVEPDVEVEPLAFCSCWSSEQTNEAIHSSYRVHHEGLAEMVPIIVTASLVIFQKNKQLI